MTWRRADPTATDPDERPSRLSCDVPRQRFAAGRNGALKPAGPVTCFAAVIGFPTALEARDQARGAGWQTAVYGENVDRCPLHIGQAATG